MRQVIDEDTGKIKLTPVWVGRKLRPTRANVLNPAAIGAFTPGSSIYPRDPLWKTSEVKKHTEALDQLLSIFKGDDEYHEVDIDNLIKIISEMPSRSCSGYVWEDERVKQALQAMKIAGIHKGILNVRRGKKSDGLGLNNQTTPPPWQGSGFANSQWLNKPRKEYPDFPVLVVMYEKGEKQKNWDDQPLYLPTLILPKNKFVFMFNYSEESEEVEEQQEDELEWDDSEEIDEN
jgi:hypothetical protein